MTKAYDQTIAAHYAAYRPPLHGLILQRILPPSENFAIGLDLGCGTGRSAHALAAYCDHVYALEPSAAMLNVATPDDDVTYLGGRSEQLPVRTNRIDVVTLAGSLFYANVVTAASEIIRVCLAGACVIAYDFQVLLDEALASFDLGIPGAKSSYNPRANFSGCVGFKEMEVVADAVELPLEPIDLAHLSLADPTRHDVFARRYDTLEPTHALASELYSMGPLTLRANIFYSSYQVGGNE